MNTASSTAGSGPRPPPDRLRLRLHARPEHSRSGFQLRRHWTLGGRLSNNNLSDFIYGKASAFAQISPLYNNLVRDLYGAYIQDNFKVNRRLTLNLGLRWNPFVQFEDKPSHQISQFDPEPIKRESAHQRFPNLPPGVFSGGDPGVPDTVVPTNYAFFDPRVGSGFRRVRQRQNQSARGLRTFPRCAHGAHLQSPVDVAAELCAR